MLAGLQDANLPPTRRINTSVSLLALWNTSETRRHTRRTAASSGHGRCCWLVQLADNADRNIRIRPGVKRRLRCMLLKKAATNDVCAIPIRLMQSQSTASMTACALADRFTQTSMEGGAMHTGMTADVTNPASLPVAASHVVTTATGLNMPRRTAFSGVAKL